MERSMEIKVVSARDLNNVNLLMKMDVYVVVKLVAADGASPKSDHKFKTPVDKEGGSNPIWNHSVKFAVDEAAARANRLTLVFELRCQRNLGDKDIGEVYVPVKELLDSTDAAAADGKADLMQHLSYQVRKPSGNPQGVLNFGFRFGDNSSPGPIKPNPVQFYTPASAYPPPHPQPEPVSFAAAHCGTYPPPPRPQPEAYPPASNLYPVLPPPMTAHEIGYSTYAPPSTATGYSAYSPAPSYSSYAPAPSYNSYPPPPSQQGYGYNHQPPPSTSAYGYPPPPTYGGYPPQPSYYPPPSQKNKSNMGLGVGAGLAGGIVGGLLIGDMVDGGFGDGFDF